MKNPILRQGDVLLVPVAKLPGGCVEIPPENGRIVLMHGEVTGHAHAIADWHPAMENARAAADAVHDAAFESASAVHDAQYQEAFQSARDAIGLAGRRARLLRAPDGNRYLEVGAPVSLKHEEHTAHQIPAGIYELPQQMEHTADRAPRRVED